MSSSSPIFVPSLEITEEVDIVPLLFALLELKIAQKNPGIESNLFSFFYSSLVTK